ncbi:hypothetical protein Har1130_00150 [Haloarcula sp. CBA1130]|uniref:hypothetical protein n=1 Tax=unclassified Haloarcula TaxID=2624677 RepID=UPI001244EB31|nr:MULTISPECIES: hypothetical protein [unclassified Haloarcula]KAA9399502.1 hypothetical protein Har1129_15270 [Haloarcula sp. CBA1129]KAA9401226.1 hypothetical protein Har1130_00150 [Haloarcula sp. CBA1130]
MHVQNRDGDPVDPVPFLVCTAMAVMLLFSLGPLYGLAYGLPVWAGLAVATVGTIAVAAVSYHRLIWMAPPPSVHIAPELRFQRLIYIGVGFAVLLVAVSAPLAL